MDSALRLFIAIELPPPVQAVMTATIRTLATRNLAVRWVDPAGTHLTLKFLGATPPDRVDALAVAMHETVATQNSFQLATADLGVFPNLRAPRVVWIGVTGDLAALHTLQAGVEGKIAPLGFPTEQRPFSPHLTLGRSDKAATGSQRAAIGATVAAMTAPTPVTWQVSRLALIRSELLPTGARYTALQHIELG
jgi:2'-5' RNA ligase